MLPEAVWHSDGDKLYGRCTLRSRHRNDKACHALVGCEKPSGKNLLLCEPTLFCLQTCDERGEGYAPLGPLSPLRDRPGRQDRLQDSSPLQLHGLETHARQVLIPLAAGIAPHADAS
jgi:hypothetical protein